MSLTIAPSPITQDEINNILWKACDAFRGTVEYYKTTSLVYEQLKLITETNQGQYV